MHWALVSQLMKHSLSKYKLCYYIQFTLLVTW